MSTPREDYAAAIRAQGRQARQLAAQLDSRGRALLVADLVRGVYDAVKFDAPEGGGLDGRDGPERRGLGRLSDAAMNHAGEVARAGFAQERSITTP